MTVPRPLFILLFFVLLVVEGFGFDIDARNNSMSIDTYTKRLKEDSLSITKILDSARLAFEERQYEKAIVLAQRSHELAKSFPGEDYTIQSMLLLARSHKNKHLAKQTDHDFNQSLKYYLKTINLLESVNSKVILPQLYLEYGDFYAALNLPKLTIENYKKALEIILDSEHDKSVLKLQQDIAELQYNSGDLSEAIKSYEQLTELQLIFNDEDAYIHTLTTLSELYREIDDYDNALSAAKKILVHYKKSGDVKKEITLYNRIGEISYEAGNNYQAKSYFVEYLELLKEHENIFEEEVASSRYVNTLLTMGEIYKWSTDNGYLSDYELAIRHFSKAQKFVNFQQNPAIASEILSQTGNIYYNKGDYKTCVTYFNLALYYAKRIDDLDEITENHLMLARAYSNLGMTQLSVDNYEAHASYKDSLMIDRETRESMQEQMQMTKRTDNLRVEELVDQIKEREHQELTIAEKELRNTALERELEMIRRTVALKEALLQNQLLAEDSVRRNHLLTLQQLENAQNQQKIENLRAEREKQDLILQNQQADQQNKRQRIKILEQENSLARSRQAYYVLSIILISLVLIFILIVHMQKRRANRVLRRQKEKIEQQAKELKHAYQNLELLSTIGRDITATLIIDEIIETVYANLNALMDASVFGIGVYDSKKNALYFPGVIERNERLKDINIDLSDRERLAAKCFLKQEEILIGNYYMEYEKFIKPSSPPELGDDNATSIIYVPLTIGSKKLGVLTVQSFRQHAFNDYHINIVRNIAIYTKIALENANVYREIEKKSRSLIHANKNIKSQNKLIEEQYQQLLQINEEKNNLMRILAHDLRNPLATAMSMTELVRFERKNLSAEQYQASEIIWRGLKRMNDMIRKILDIKAVESNQVFLEYDIINAVDILVSIENAFALEANQKMINLQMEHDEEELYLKVDRNYFNQIVENLVSNAIKFSEHGTNITIRVSGNGDHIQIAVKDEGPGIPENELPRLFQKYQKLSTRPTAGEQSIGLGLSIVKKYVEVMGGRVWCESKVGEGTVFYVEFPKAAVPVS